MPSSLRWVRLDGHNFGDEFRLLLVLVLPTSLFEHPAAELSEDDSAVASKIRCK
jgi:hypothetical protein